MNGEVYAIKKKELAIRGKPIRFHKRTKTNIFNLYYYGGNMTKIRIFIEIKLAYDKLKYQNPHILPLTINIINMI